MKIKLHFLLLMFFGFNISLAQSVTYLDLAEGYFSLAKNINSLENGDYVFHINTSKNGANSFKDELILLNDQLELKKQIKFNDLKLLSAFTKNDSLIYIAKDKTSQESDSVFFYYCDTTLAVKQIKALEVFGTSGFIESDIGVRIINGKYITSLYNRDIGKSIILEFDENLNHSKTKLIEDIGGISTLALSESIYAANNGDGVVFYNTEWEKIKQFDLPKEQVGQNAGDTAIKYASFYNGVAYSSGVFMATIEAELTYILSNNPPEVFYDQQFLQIRFDEQGNYLSKRFIGSDDWNEDDSFGYYDALRGYDEGKFILHEVARENNSSGGSVALVTMSIYKNGDYNKQFIYAFDEADYFPENIIVNEAGQDILMIGEAKYSDVTKLYIFRLFYNYDVGIQKVESPDFEFSIFPNPVHNKLNISGTKSLKAYSIFSSSGALLIAGFIKGNEAELNVDKLPTGNYLLVVSADDDSKSAKHFLKK